MNSTQLPVAIVKGVLGACRSRTVLLVAGLASVLLWLGVPTELLAAVTGSPPAAASTALDGGLSGIAAPELTAADYPSIRGVNARVAVWLVAQLHLWFAAFVLAVPIFVFIIEAIGMKTRDKRYDDMAYEFIKISIAAYSLTAILGGLLVFSLIVFYPDLVKYLSAIFKDTMFYYALVFFAESACLYLYYYGWHWLQ
ncbi:MAG: cytochrome ubiquinol oxidase subunit I, partial [Arenicellales bacterium]|nr:cytochrome ubiquinol oxidase subunit I [Arenicellales bacterium]